MIAYKRTRRGWLKVLLFLAIFILGMTITFAEVEGSQLAPQVSVHVSE